MTNVAATRSAAAHRPEFAKLWTAHTASNLSDGIRLAALPLLAASVTRSPAAVGGLFVAQQMPSLLFGLPAGALVDRVDRRHLLAGVHALRAVLVAGLALAVVADAVTMPLLYAIAAVLGTAEAIFDTAGQALVPDVVAAESLDRANGLLESGMLAGNQFIGPAAGGLMFAMAASGPFVLDAGILMVATLAVVALRPAARPPAAVAATRPRLRRQIAEGVVWLWREPLLRRITVFAGSINFLVNTTLAIHVLYALEVLRLAPSRYGVLLAAYAVGGIAGGVLAGPLLTRFSRTGVIPYAIALAALSTLVMGLTSSAVVAAAMEVLSALGGTVWAVATVSLRQAWVPGPLYGRVTGAHRLVSFGGAALGSAAGATLAAMFGLRLPFLAAGTLLFVLAGLAVLLIRQPVSPSGLTTTSCATSRG